MQGGCTCENGLPANRAGQYRHCGICGTQPLGLTAADDWTIELKEKGHPDLDGLYRMIGSTRHFDAHFKHNYNHVSSPTSL